MGARYCEVWCKVSPEAPAEALDEVFDAPPAPGAWVRVSQDDFDADVLSGEGGLCPEEVVACGETIYLAMYDGPAGELCGSFAYEHVIDGQVARALTYAPAADERLCWVRVEGAPEAWETPFLASQLDAQLARWREERTWEEPPLPAPTPAEEAAARVAALRFTKGERLPRPSEYALCAQVARAYGLGQPPG